MDPLAHALARSRAYGLFAALYRDGLSAAHLAVVAAVPPLAEALPPAFDADAAAADHHGLFGLDVFPYASVFLGADGRPGGQVTAFARAQYRQAACAPEGAGEPADHLGAELAFAAFLCGAESDAWVDARGDEAARMQALQRRFLDTHLLWWLPALVQAVRRHGHPFYAALAALTLDLVLDHRAALGPPVATPSPPLPPPPALLERPETGLADLAAYLTTPAWSGLYLSRTDLARLGRAEALPRGFGPRPRELANLLRSAATFDRLGALLAWLRALVADWRGVYEPLAAGAVPGLPEKAAAWLARLDGTARVVDEVEAALRRG